jgi:hypothetical protein
MQIYIQARQGQEIYTIQDQIKDHTDDTENTHAGPGCARLRPMEDKC